MSPKTTAVLPPPTIGMLGAGFMARTHTHAARQAGASLEAIASSSLESAERAAQELGDRRAMGTDELRAEALPVVRVCSPNSSHVAYALAALSAGSHVICEKPLSPSAADARALAAPAEASGLLGAVPFVYRYHPMVREA